MRSRLTARIKRDTTSVAANLVKRAECSTDIAALTVEAEVLARRFGVEPPRLPVLALPPNDPDLNAALAPAREPMPTERTRPFDATGRFDLTPRDDGSVSVKGASGSRVISGETGRVLATAGPWSRTRQDAERDRTAGVQREELMKQAERDRTDEWLRRQMAAGPVTADAIKIEARSRGSRSPAPALRGEFDGVVRQARSRRASPRRHDRGRRDVRDRSRVLWGLPGYGRDAFAEVDGQRSRMPAGAMRW